jgi:hypothetical protein
LGTFEAHLVSVSVVDVSYFPKHILWTYKREKSFPMSRSVGARTHYRERRTERIPRVFNARFRALCFTPSGCCSTYPIHPFQPRQSSYPPPRRPDSLTLSHSLYLSIYPSISRGGAHTHSLFSAMLVPTSSPPRPAFPSFFPAALTRSSPHYPAPLVAAAYFSPATTFALDLRHPAACTL